MVWRPAAAAVAKAQAPHRGRQPAQRGGRLDCIRAKGRPVTISLGYLATSAVCAAFFPVQRASVGSFRSLADGPIVRGVPIERHVVFKGV